jgi:outer membrane murein-binding lipoprotein Lpp
MKKLALVLASLAVVAFAQQGKVAARDAGVPPPKPSPADAGTAVEPLRSPTAPPAAELEKLRKEVSELRARVVDLEQKASKVDALTSDVEKLRGKLDALRADFDAAEERRNSAERETATRKAQTTQATATVTTVLQQLSLGNTSNVDLWLRGAEQQYSGNASKLVSLARGALAQGDLNAARQYLNLAVLEAGP